MADEVGEATQPRRPQKQQPPAATVLPLPLRNWQVLDETGAPIEIDGEATLVTMALRPVVASGASEDKDDPAPTPAPTLESTDQIDEELVVTLHNRRQAIEAGATATYELTLLNNGPQQALFAIRFAEGQPGRWLVGPLPDVLLQPGERTTVLVALTPPRAPISRAGDYQLTFVVTADAYPEQQSQVTAQLTIAPFIELKVGKLVAPYRTLTWWRRSVTVTGTIVNSGNQPTAVLVRAQDGAGVCQIAFHGAGLRQMGQQQALVTIPPGRVTPVIMQLYAQSQVWFGRSKRICPIHVSVAAKATPKVTQNTALKVALAPVIGPWQVASLLGLFAFVVTGVGLGGLALLIALLVSFAQPAAPAPTVVAPPPPSIVTILVQPAPSAPQAAANVVTAPAVANVAPVVVNPAREPQPDLRNPAVPLVQPDQVSSPAGASAINATGGAASQSAGQTTMTYAQMFQAVGQRYDLNWRMLAAQAYVESSFDPLALGSHGDLGLMQIRPSTWQEWAPTVTAADPFDSYSNVMVAAVYLDYLRTTLTKEGHPEREWMLVAYNWGPDKVLQHLAKGGRWEDLAPERRRYAEEVLRLAETIPADAAF
jgi:soluble lytic murein transglycosylase-like protein